MVLGELIYTVKAETQQAEQSMRATDQTFKQLGQSGESAAQGMNQLPQTYQTIVTEGNKVTTTTRQVQQTMQGTVTTVTRATNVNRSFGQALKDNVLAIGFVASSVIGLVAQYTQLQRAQNTLQRAEGVEAGMKARLVNLTNKHADAVAKYGANSREALKIENDINVLQQKHGTQLEKIEIMQTQFNERVADFAVNILPNLIGISTGVIQVLQNWRGQQAANVITTVESTIAQDANNAAILATVPAADAAKVAVNGLGMSMKRALIGTGIGIAIVAITTFLSAFAENWWGVRDAVNAAGVAIGNAVPQIRPLLDVLQQAGIWLTRLLGGDLPTAALKTSGAVDDTSQAMAESGKEANKFAGKLDDLRNSADELWMTLGGDKKARNDLLESLGLKGFKGMKDLDSDIKHVSQSFGDLNKILQFEFELPDYSKLFDIPKGLLPKLAREASHKLQDIKKHLKPVYKKAIGELQDDIKDDAKKGGKHTAEIVAQFVVDHPELYQLLKDHGFIDDKTATLIQKKQQEFAQTVQHGLVDTMSQQDWDAIMAIPYNAFKNYDPVQKDDIVNGKKQKHTWFKHKDDSTTHFEGLLGQIKSAVEKFDWKSVQDTIVKGLFTFSADASMIARNWIDPVLGAVIENATTYFTVEIPNLIKNTFTWDNFNAGLKLLTDLASKFAAGLWALLSDPVETAKQINTFVTNALKALGAWFIASFPKTGAALLKVGALIGGTIMLGLQQLTDWGQTGLTWISSQINAAFSGGGQAVANLLKAGRQVLDLIWDGITNAPGMIWDNIAKTIGEKLGGALSNIGGGLGWLFDQVKKLFPQNVEAAKDPNDKNQPATVPGSNVAPWMDTLNRQIEQVTKVTNVLGRAVRGLSADFGTITKSAQQYIAAYNILNHAETQIFNETNVLGRATRGLSSDVGQVTKSIKQWIAANNILNRTETQVFRETNVLGRATRGLSSDVGQLTKSYNKLTSTLKDVARAFIAVAIAAKKARAASGGSNNGGGTDSAQKGMHKTLRQDTMIMAHKGERVDIGHGDPRAGYAPGDSGGGGPGGTFLGTIVIQLGTKKWIQEVEFELGQNAKVFVP